MIQSSGFGFVPPFGFMSLGWRIDVVVKCGKFRRRYCRSSGLQTLRIGHTARRRTRWWPKPAEKGCSRTRSEHQLTNPYRGKKGRTHRKTEVVSQECQRGRYLVVGLTKQGRRDTARKTLVQRTANLTRLTGILEDTGRVGQGELGSGKVRRSETGDEVGDAVRYCAAVPILGEAFGDVTDRAVLVGLHAVDGRDGFIVGDAAGTVGSVRHEATIVF